MISFLSKRAYVLRTYALLPNTVFGNILFHRNLWRDKNLSFFLEFIYKGEVDVSSKHILSTKMSSNLEYDEIRKIQEFMRIGDSRPISYNFGHMPFCLKTIIGFHNFFSIIDNLSIYIPNM